MSKQAAGKYDNFRCWLTIIHDILSMKNKGIDLEYIQGVALLEFLDSFKSWMATIHAFFSLKNKGENLD